MSLQNPALERVLSSMQAAQRKIGDRGDPFSRLDVPRFIRVAADAAQAATLKVGYHAPLSPGDRAQLDAAMVRLRQRFNELRDYFLKSQAN